MTELLDVVRANVSPDCLTQRCRRPGCGISLQDAPEPRLIIDFDKPGSPLGQSETRCDFLFIAEESNIPGWVAPLELKGGRVDISEAIEQLQAGASAAEELIPKTQWSTFVPSSPVREYQKRNGLRSKARCVFAIKPKPCD